MIIRSYAKSELAMLYFPDASPHGVTGTCTLSHGYLSFLLLSLSYRNTANIHNMRASSPEG